jgi:ribonuclease P protein component
VRPFVSLRGRREFTLAMRRGGSASTQALTVYAFSPRAPVGAKPKVGFVVTKKVGGAVVRNLIRRRCKAILETALRPPSAGWYVVQCRPAAAELAFSELRRQLIDAAERASRPRKPRA